MQRELASCKGISSANDVAPQRGAIYTPVSFSGECVVTRPNGSSPTDASPSDRFFGNGKLWVELWRDGNIVFRPGGPGFIRHDGSLSMKFAWWRGVSGQLTICGHRLDSPAPPLRFSVPSGYGKLGFQPSMLTFPTEGCWEVTGRIDNTATLTFVTKVTKIGA